MQLVLTSEDLSTLSDATRDELLAKLLPRPVVPPTNLPQGMDPDAFDDVVDMTPGQIEEFMGGCAPQTIAGLRLFAQHGPVVHADLLSQAGITNYAHFQGAVTKRTRTVTGKKGAYLFAWDDWSSHPSGIGSYVVTPATLRSLKIFFNLD